MKKVLIVSNYFPPINAIASKRFGVMCRYFEEFGYMPYILTVNASNLYDTTAQMDLEVPIDEERITRIGRFGEIDIIPQWYYQFFFKILEERNIFFVSLDRQSVAWAEQIKKEIDLSKLKDIDIVVGTYSIMGNIMVADYISRKLGCPFVADLRDLISDYRDSTMGRENRCFFLERMVEEQKLCHAAGITVVNPELKKLLMKRYFNKPIVTIYNGWDECRRGRPTQIAGKYLYYAGALIPHRTACLKVVAKCLKKINYRRQEKIKLVVRTNLSVKECEQDIINFFKKEDMQDFALCLESTTDEIVAGEIEGAYINLALNTLNEKETSYTMAVSGKVFELLKSSRPILAISPEESALNKMMKYTQKGIATISEQEIEKFILGECENYKGNDNIRFFSRKEQARKFCKFMDKILNCK